MICMISRTLFLEMYGSMVIHRPIVALLHSFSVSGGSFFFGVPTDTLLRLCPA